MPFSEAELNVSLKSLRAEIDPKFKETDETRQLYGNSYKEFIDKQQEIYKSYCEGINDNPSDGTSKNVVNRLFYNKMKKFKEKLDEGIIKELQAEKTRAYDEAYKNWQDISSLRTKIGEDVFSAKCPKTTDLYELYRGEADGEKESSDDPAKLKESIKKLKGMNTQWDTVRKNENIKEAKDVNEFLKNVEEEKKEYEQAKVDSTKLISYIKTKIGTKNQFKTKINDYSKNYKGENDVIPLKEMKEIYGNKGVLRLVCRLEDGSISGTKKKRSSNYVKICNTIRKNYKSLKMESLLGVLEKRSTKNFGDMNKKKVDSFGMTLSNLIYSLSNDGINLDSYKLLKKDIDDLNSTKKTFTSKYFSKIKSQILKLENDLKKAGKSSDTKSEESSNTLVVLKSVIQKIRNWEGELSHSERYIKKYNKFVNESGKLAEKYLKKEADKKMNKFSKCNENDKFINTCKIAAMCLVAVCSKKKSAKECGGKYFDEIFKKWPTQNGQAETST